MILGKSSNNVMAREASLRRFCSIFGSGVMWRLMEGILDQRRTILRGNGISAMTLSTELLLEDWPPHTTSCGNGKALSSPSEHREVNSVEELSLLLGLE
jgi:hypothetical protein